MSMECSGAAFGEGAVRYSAKAALMAVAAFALAALLASAACSQNAPSSQASAPETVQVAGDGSTVRFALPETWDRLHSEDGGMVYYDGASSDPAMAVVVPASGSAQDAAQSWADVMTASGVETSRENVGVGGSEGSLVECSLDGKGVAVYFLPIDDDRYAKVAFQSDEGAIDEVSQLVYSEVPEGGDATQWAGDDQVGYVKLPLDFIAMHRDGDSAALDYYIPDSSKAVGGDPLEGATVVELPGNESGPISDEFFESAMGDALRDEQVGSLDDGFELWAMVIDSPTEGMLAADYEYLADSEAAMVDVRYAPEAEGEAAYSEYDEVAKSYVSKKPGTGEQDVDALNGAAKNLLGYVNMGVAYENPDFGFKVVTRPGDTALSAEQVQRMSALSFKRGSGVTDLATITGPAGYKQTLLVESDFSGTLQNTGSAQAIADETLSVYNYASSGYGGQNGMSAHAGTPAFAAGRELPTVVTDGGALGLVTVEAFLDNGTGGYIEFIAQGASEDEARDMLTRVLAL